MLLVINESQRKWKHIRKAFARKFSFYDSTLIPSIGFQKKPEIGTR